MGTLKCRRCGTEQDSSIKCCRNCGVFMEGPAINNVTGEAGYRGADGVFYKSFQEYSRRDGRQDVGRPDWLPEGTDLDELAASAERAGIGRVVWKDDRIEEAPIFPVPEDTRVTGFKLDLEKGPTGLPIRQLCFIQDDVEYKLKVYMRSRPDENAQWGARGGWELKRVLQAPPPRDKY